MDGQNAIDCCLIILIVYLGLRSAHSVYHLDADEDEDESLSYFSKLVNS